MRPLTVLKVSLLLLFALPLAAQDLPKKIRGYTVHRESVTVKTVDEGDTHDHGDAVIKIGDPTSAEVSISGVSFQLLAEVRANKQSGKVHFLTFHDFRVNGIPVQIEEYAEAFSFEKTEMVKLPKPATIILPTTSLLRAASKEMLDARKEWSITGRVFVFGRFRKFGFYHKRVVPIEINVRIQNPLIAKDLRHSDSSDTTPRASGRP